MSFPAVGLADTIRQKPLHPPVINQHMVFDMQSLFRKIFSIQKKGGTTKKLNGFLCFFKPNCKLCANWWGKLWENSPKFFTHRKEIANPIPTIF